MDYNCISFAGAGRVGSAISRELFRAGYSIDTVVSTSEKGKAVAKNCDAKWSSDLSFNDSTSIIIVAVPDRSLESALKKIKCNPETLVVHTAGSYGMEVFPENLKRKGVLYPLQTFSLNREVNFSGLPFLIEASDKVSLEHLKSTAESIGGNVHYANAESRRMLHLAAVFACNFTNHMITESRDISEKAGFSLEILKPLINETISKALADGPDKSQTGPAYRNDSNTIGKHMELLSFSPELQEVYNRITNSIIHYYKNTNSGQF
jgi:predicted short-subunit dehydrogenase-like oxidoreductase (DUF2520 family)